MLVDLLGGYESPAPGTLIKGPLALVAALIVKAMKESKASPESISAVVSEDHHGGGLLLRYASLLLGKGWGAAASIPAI